MSDHESPVHANTRSAVNSTAKSVVSAEVPSKDESAKRTDNCALVISLREIAEILGVSKPTIRQRLKREGIQPIRHSPGLNAKLWYPRREVNRFFCRLGLV